MPNTVSEQQKLFADEDDFTAKSFFIISLDISRRSDPAFLAYRIPRLSRRGALTRCGSLSSHLLELKNNGFLLKQPYYCQA
ncbi:MAG: hypothetical protein IJM18_04560 [Clostridia bacterium]|nr:hypothetical protein [Clostridia bacterium]